MEGLEKEMLGNFMEFVYIVKEAISTTRFLENSFGSFNSLDENRVQLNTSSIEIIYFGSRTSRYLRERHACLSGSF